MLTLFEVWSKNEKELEALFVELNIDLDDRHKFRLFQIKCQREEIRAMQNELKN